MEALESGYGKATEVDIVEFETEIGFELPGDYRDFLKEYNGGPFKRNEFGFNVPGLGEKIPADVLYGLKLKRGLDLRPWHEEYKDEIPTKSLIIGSDPGGGMIVLFNDPENSGVYYWDHSWAFEKSNEGNNSYKIADSFTAFMSAVTRFEE